MLTATLYGLGTALPLLIGAAIGLRYDLPRPVLAALMAFGAGTMVAAVSTELFQPAFETEGIWTAGAALFAGALVYVVADRLIENKLGAGALGWALMLGSLLDGIPENTALGVTISSAGGVVLLVAVAVGNVPEAVAGAASMRSQPNFNRSRALSVWAATAVLLVLVVIAADAVADTISDSAIATVQAFAGGATIAVLADSLMPEAYREGGWWVGLSTALGFLVAFGLGA
ncbi:MULTISPECIES: ZIP family metal transporter [unclassified Rhodococcus (in: high G+C Gram-positive bacteria)]|uniref:ZIP family metal transporter n=1 Tax=unclassified Rhodococcus (in: high G+C Gram-positive bacteria) TaxID=192944 RepID=UPI00163ABC79|nr:MULTISPECIES: ZIP family metal transporter [unclassified Rhodococcus (in: high G+C Gram-positive bacteria)]MBC2641741.1 ZIP family metal transporter [Rhodococcus sp. 3A]MBC2893514.1 ZIP family metal transporter [Rhodococcus sp. 4CII]